ncbi:hypothetical protein OIU79_011316 [Salix purpurea]|uniref:Uncharacterized protein n=1 Tax=Salix purpurea TaxID=77065 RepID=A0A9Q0Q0E5_SALPP|nr:hypothetical protein OIU79_011316 [Salix purpurea]
MMCCLCSWNEYFSLLFSSQVFVSKKKD